MFERSCVKRSIFIEKLVQRFVTFKFPFSDIFLFFFFSLLCKKPNFLLS